MSQELGRPDQDAAIDIIAIVTRASDGAALAFQDDQTSAWPRLRMDREDFRAASPVNDAMAVQFGMSTTVLRCLQQVMSDGGHIKHRAYLLEAHGNDAIPVGASWMQRKDLMRLKLSSDLDKEALDAWLVGSEGDAAQLCPWSNAGWWDDSVGWMDGELARLGIERTGPFEQLRAWALSSIIRTSTSRGYVYFKAVPSFMAQEGPAMAAVSQAYPNMAPPLLAADASRGWILMPGFGGRLLINDPDVSHWEQAVRLHAQLQIEQAERTQSWLRVGLPDRSIRRMVDLIDPLITISSRVLSGRADGLSDDDIQALQELSMRLKFMCAQLADFDIPHSVMHGDLGGNIVVKDDGGFVFFDWTDACVSHPFFDMTTMANTVFDDNLFQDDESVSERLRDAYLEPWLKCEPMDRLIQAYDAAKPLGALHQAMSYMWILTNISEHARWELEGGLLQWIRTLLRLCGQR